MAARVKARKIFPGAFISSPAKRAKKTAELFCEGMGADKDAIIYFSALYHAPAPVFFEVVKEIGNDIEIAAIFSHNPGITHFVNQLCSDVRLDNMPTCGVFAVNAHCSTWKEFEKAKKDFLFFDYPRNI